MVGWEDGWESGWEGGGRVVEDGGRMVGAWWADGGWMVGGWLEDRGKGGGCGGVTLELQRESQGPVRVAREVRSLFELRGAHRDSSRVTAGE